MGYTTGNKIRPLNIKFDVYTDGEDNEFKSELVTLMRGSVLELQNAATHSFKARSAELFKKAAHKAKSTLVLLDDQELLQAVEEFKEHLCTTEQHRDHPSVSKIDKLNELCDSIVESLEREAAQLRSS